MPNERDRRNRTLGENEELVDVETLRSCFDEGCELVVDADGRILGADGAGTDDPSLQTLSKLRRWFGR